MWTMARDERAWSGADPPGVVYEYAPNPDLDVGSRHRLPFTSGIPSSSRKRARLGKD